MIEHVVETDGTLSPPRETHRVLSRAKTLSIVAGGTKYVDAMVMTMDDEGNLLIACESPNKRKPAKKGKK